MSSKKRKTLQIKRPDSGSAKSKKKPLPKVNMDDKAATSSVDTDELAAMEPKDVGGGKGKKAGKGKATRVSLPNEEKIRQARRASATQDLEREGAMPSADQIAHAQKSATLPIMIDTEDVEDGEQALPQNRQDEEADRTMEIDVESLQTGDVGDELKKAGASSPQGGDQTMKINADDLATGDVGEKLKEADRGDKNQGSDQTMQVDADALSTGDISEELAEADRGGKQQGSDQTMQVDADALSTGEIGKELAEADKPRAQGGDQTMQVDADALSTGDLSEELDEAGKEGEDGDKTMQFNPEDYATREMDKVEEDEIMSKETMRMENPEEDPEKARAFNAATMSIDSPEGDGGEQGAETDLDAETMEESFNANTMEMDSEQLERELAKGNDAPKEEEEPSSLDSTMDMTQERPKTIMIKRPSKKAGPSTPTVKAVRPDAQTIRTASPSTPKEDTSRIDMPGDEAAAKEGKTIKLKRPSGGSAGRSRPSIQPAGTGPGSFTSTTSESKDLGVAWLAVAVVTMLISLGALWTTYALVEPELPMPGRLVDANNQLRVDSL